MICETCGVELKVADWPFCPHGVSSGAAVIGDEFPGGGGRWIENLDHDPVWCQTKSDLKREMDQRNLRHPDRHVPGDTQLTNWALGIDPYTLAAATALVSRGAEKPEPAIVCETLTRYLGPVQR